MAENHGSESLPNPRLEKEEVEFRLRSFYAILLNADRNYLKKWTGAEKAKKVLYNEP